MPVKLCLGEKKLQRWYQNHVGNIFTRGDVEKAIRGKGPVWLNVETNKIEGNKREIVKSGRGGCSHCLVISERRTRQRYGLVLTVCSSCSNVP